jgi:[acyl-carrier-protein] S-malonyltransferase
VTATAVIFPGQGVRTADLRAVVEENDPRLLPRVESLVGADAFARAGESTRYAQPAIFCVDLALWRHIRPALEEDRPLAFSGHSLGELPALVAAGCLDQEAGLWLAVERGRLTAEVAKETDGAMLALLGFGAAEAAELAAAHGVHLSNDNCPGQIVLSGTREDLESVLRAAESAERRALMLEVEGAFHSPLMEEAVAPFEALLAQVGFEPPQRPVFSGIAAEPFDDVPAQLAAALTRPVRWSDTVRALDRFGVRRFVECGPERVLTKLVNRILHPHGEEVSNHDQHDQRS